jgi:phage gp29-like protein
VKPKTKKKPTPPIHGDLPRGGNPAEVPTFVDDAALAHITPSLRALAVPIDSITPDPRNARKHGERNSKAIADSLKGHGQVKPIVLDADGVILAGNGTYAAALELGWKFIAAVKTPLRGVEARAFAIRDNRTAELATWDAQELTELSSRRSRTRTSGSIWTTWRSTRPRWTRC